jgi:HAD superfamily hydrolase (TIGR01549 family)
MKLDQPVDMNNLFEIASKYPIVSFDIFDTILLRKVKKPADIFKIVGLKHPEFGPNFAERRVNAERVSRVDHFNKFGNHETTYKEIYNQLKVPSEAEFEIEKQFIHLNSEIGDLILRLQKIGIKIIFISDIYFSEKEIQILLKVAKAPKPDKLFISSDLQLSKSKGDIYPFVASQLKVDMDHIIHIGDNEHADVLMAKKYGINSHLYIEKRNKLKDSKKYLNELSEHDIFASVIFGVLTTDQIYEEALDENYWRNLGFSVAGPIYAGFLFWLEECFKRDKIKKAYFVSRDGYLPKKYYDEYFGRIETIYLYQSRKVLAQLIAEIDFEKFINIFMQQSRVSLFEALNAYDLIGINSIKYDAFYLKNEHKRIDREELRKGVPKLLRKHHDSIVKHSRNSNGEYLNYLGSVLKDSQNNAFIDIGWHGSQQKLTTCVTSIPFTGYVLGLNPWASDPWGIRGYVYDHLHMDDQFQTVQQSVEVFELLFSAPNPSIVGVMKGEIGFDPIFSESNDLSGKHEQIVNQIDLGLHDFLSMTMPLLRQIGNEFSTRSALAMAHELLFYPGVQDIEILGKHSHNPNPGNGRATSLIPEPSFKNVKMTFIFWRVGYLRKLQQNRNRFFAHILLFIEYLKIAQNLGLKRSLKVIKNRFEKLRRSRAI